jgi:hypothetical protein
VAACVNAQMHNIVRIKPMPVLSAGGNAMLGGKLRMKFKDDNCRLLALDAGSVNNSFALILARLIANDKDQTVTPCIDGIAELIPSPTTPINFNALCDFLEEKREWIKGTDYDFSMDYDLYQWCWGPDFMYSDSM